MNHFKSPLPERVRLLILGGGIHGTGLLHDMASRGWQDCHLIEKAEVGAATSSRSTKLIHGGLRYLKNIRDFGLVSEALRERKLLGDLVDDIAKPLEFCLPVLSQGGHSRFVLRSGLYLYDFLAGRQRIKRHRVMSIDEVSEKLPLLNQQQFKRYYSYWDLQTDDLALTERVAASAARLGAGISTGCQALKILPEQDGWSVEVRDPHGEIKRISALYVFNALGPWANRFLEDSDIEPHYVGVNSKGIHLMLPDMGLKMGVFLQSPDDARIFFVLPWQGYTLIGTTESLFEEHPDKLQIDQQDEAYLLSRCNRYFHTPVQPSDVISRWAGLRWLALEPGQKNLSATTRSYSLSTHASSGRGIMYTLYGGKLTTYRSFAQDLGDQICQHFGEFRSSTTHKKSSWATREQSPAIKDSLLRFG